MASIIPTPRIDLDPVPGEEWPQIRQVVHVVREARADFGLTGWRRPLVRRRAPDLGTSAWWEEKRRGVFLDHKYNAKDWASPGCQHLGEFFTTVKTAYAQA